MTANVPLDPTFIRCPWCNNDIDAMALPTAGIADCPICRRQFEAIRFDAPVRAPDTPATIDGSLDAAQPCAMHARNAAVANCERCGSFICALCRIDIDGKTLCPNCFERLASEGALESTRTVFRDYNGLASVTATAGCVLWFLSLLFGPLAIYYGVRSLKQKKEMGERDGLAGTWAAIVLGAAESVGSVVFIGMFIMRMFR